MKKTVNIFSITAMIIIMILCIGCSNNTNSHANDIISFEEYQDLFEKLVNELQVEGFALKGNTLGPNVIIVDKDLTFGQRSYLTLDGEFDTSDPKSTDEIIIFENDSETKLVYIRIAFTKSFIGNDLISWTSTRGFGETNEQLAKMTDLATLTYKNLVILVNQVATDGTDINTTKEFLRKIIHILN